MSREVKKGSTPGLPKLPDSDVQERPSDDPEVARQEALAEEIMLTTGRCCGR